MKYHLKNHVDSTVFSILLVSAAHLVHDIFTSFLAPVLPILIEKYGMTLSLAGILVVILRLPSILNPLIGYFSDNIGLKYFLVTSVSVTGICMCLIGNTGNYTVLLILLLIAGISNACFHVPAPVMLKHLTKKGLGASMSSFQIGGELSRAIGPLIVITAVEFWGIENLFYIIPLGLAMSLLLLWHFRGVSFKPPQKEGRSGITRNYISIISNNARTLFIPLSGLLITKSCTASIIAAFLPTLLVKRGKPLWFGGSALSILYVSAIAGIFFAGNLSDKIGRRKMLVFYSFITPVSMLLFLLSGDNLLFPAIILLGFVAFSYTPIVLSLIQEKNFSYPSVANGIFMAMSFLMSSVSILLFGWLSDQVGFHTAMYVFTFCSFAGFPVVYFMLDKK